MHKNEIPEDIGAGNIAVLLGRIYDELRRHRVSDDLWTAHDVATYLQFSVGTVRNRVLPHPTFPRAAVIPTTEEGGSRRWVAGEVKAWAKRHREVVR